MRTIQNYRHVASGQGHAPIHPMMVSYQARPEDLKPCRMSDLIPLRDWTSHPVYAELFVLT